MQKTIFIFWISCLFISFSVKGNHILGGDLTYTHVGGLTYKLTLSLYGQCGSQQGSAFDSLPTAKPKVIIRNNNTDVATIQLDIDPNSIAEITPVCKQLLGFTKCSDPNSTIPGVKKFVYSKTYTLNAVSADWKFIFDGNLGVTFAGRGSTITNVDSVGSQLLYLVAELNNASVAANNSATFTTIPTPFFCASIYNEYNQGAIDAENDSLQFDLVPALNAGVPVVYVPGYSAIHPVSVANNDFTFNQQTGQMNFTPDILQKALVVNKVREFRNGILVGSVMREMTMIVYDVCLNHPATDTITQTKNCTSSAGNFINLCLGTDSISFRANYSDADGDSVKLTYSGLPTGAALVINNNNTPSPYFNFYWHTANLPVGLYSFYVTTEETNCPINNKRTQSFTIRVAQENEVTSSILTPTNCYFRAKVKLNLNYGLLPRTVTISNGSGFSKTYTDSTGIIIDSFATGNYLVSVSSLYLTCLDASTTFSIVDSGIYPFTPPLTEPPIYCLGDPDKQLQAIPANGGIVHWYDANGILLPGAPFTNTSFVHTVLYFINQDVGNCSSKLDSVWVIVSDNPVVAVINKTGTACVGDKILLQATGAQTYVWLPSDQILFNANNEPYIRVMTPSNFQVIGINEFGCRDTVDFNFTDILPCCMFSYPTAFSPNNDGKNEVWRPVMYGNEDTYELQIFNRYGEVVFLSKTSKEGWDGSFNGEQQNVGTYYYFLKAKCLTGHEEEHKGDFLLIR